MMGKIVVSSKFKRSFRKFARRITVDTALRLARYFNMSPQFWLGLQMDYDLDLAENELVAKIAKEVKIFMPT